MKPLKLSREAVSQVSEDSYNTEFVSWRIDFFPLTRRGSEAVWKIPSIFFEPFPKQLNLNLNYVKV